MHHKHIFFFIEICTSESWINKLSVDVWFLLGHTIFAFIVFQTKSLMHITNQKLSFNIFTVGNLQNIFMEHDLYLIIFEKIYNYDLYNVLLAIATNIP